MKNPIKRKGEIRDNAARASENGSRLGEGLTFGEEGGEYS